MSAVPDAGGRIESVDDLPDAVRNWLVAQYHDNPVRFSIPDDATPFALVRLSRFNDFLLNGGLDTNSVPDVCHKVGWTHDLCYVRQLVVLPFDAQVVPEHPVLVANAPHLGVHRLIGIRQTVLDSPAGGIYGELLALAKTAQLTGKQLAAVSHLGRSGGAYPLNDLAVEFDWADPKGNAKSLARAVNVKLGPKRWWVKLHGTTLVAEKLRSPRRPRRKG